MYSRMPLLLRIFCLPVSFSLSSYSLFIMRARNRSTHFQTFCSRYKHLWETAKKNEKSMSYVWTTDVEEYFLAYIHNEKYCCIHVFVCSHYFFLSHSLSHSQWHLHAWWNFNRRWISFILSLLFIVQTYFRLFWHCEYQAKRRLCRESSPVCVALLTPWEVPELRSTTTRDINSSNNNHFKEFDNRAYAVNEEKRKSILQIK